MTGNKPKDKQGEQKSQKTTETRTAVLKSQWGPRGLVSNTVPAPSNPHQKGREKDKK
jgi:hypothetical protein